MKVMTSVKTLLGSALLATGALLVGCASEPPVPPLTIGDSVNLKDVTDQNHQPFAHQEDMKVLMFVEGMEAKELVRESLETIDTRCMKDGELVYLANISRMPSIISQLVAVPAMRDYPYPVWLDWGGEASLGLPVREDQVTVLSLDRQSIVRADYYESTSDLSRFLTTLCGPASQESP